MEGVIKPISLEDDVEPADSGQLTVDMVNSHQILPKENVQAVAKQNKVKKIKDRDTKCSTTKPISPENSPRKVAQKSKVFSFNSVPDRLTEEGKLGQQRRSPKQTAAA